MAAPGNVIRLERSTAGRLLGGFRMQPLVALLVVLLALRAVGMAAGVIHDESLPLLATVLVALVLLLVLLVGANGYAEADSAGLRWRYYLRHAFAWNEIEQITLVVKGVSIAAVRHTIEVRARGRRHVITPACSAGSGRIRFGRELLAAAAARGIAVEDGWA